MDTHEINVEPLLSRRIIDLSGNEFVALTRYASANTGAHAPVAPTQAIGITALARALSCSPSQIANMRRDGALQGCVISHVGRNYVFNVDKAREAANHWKVEKGK